MSDDTKDTVASVALTVVAVLWVGFLLSVAVRLAWWAWS